MANDSQGNLLLGLIVGFLFSCIGLILCLVLGGAETKRGAWIGFGAAVIVGVVATIVRSLGAS